MSAYHVMGVSEPWPMPWSPSTAYLSAWLRRVATPSTQRCRPPPSWAAGNSRLGNLTVAGWAVPHGLRKWGRTERSTSHG